MKGLLVRLGALLFACLAHGAWEHGVGPPLFERMSIPTALRLEQPLSLAQNPVTGEIVIGDSRQLLVFDGAEWHAYGQNERTVLFRPLAFSPDGKVLWACGVNEIGFFRRSDAGEYLYQSLSSHLSPEQHSAQVWRCQPTASGADFVAAQRVLRWDGARFKVWDFPTSKRLFPVEFEGALWFTHLETGLYRIGREGPELIAPKSMLPPHGAMGLSRHGDQLVAWSGYGATTIEATPVTLSSPELTAAMKTGNPSAITPLPGGHFAIGTVDHGLLIADVSGRLVAKYPQLDRAKPSQIWDMLRDRDGALWLAAEGGVLRVPAIGRVNGIRFDSQFGGAARGRITSDAGGVRVLGDRELYIFEPRAAGETTPAVRHMDLGPVKILSILGWRNRLFLTSHKEIKELVGEETHGRLELSSRTVYGLQALGPDSDLLATRETERITLVRPSAHKPWQNHSTFHNRSAPTSLASDPQGNLWVGENRASPSRYEIAPDLSLRDITPPEMQDPNDNSSSWVLRVRDSVWVFRAGQPWRIHPDGRRERISWNPPAAIEVPVVSPSGRQIYTAIDRVDQGTRVARGVGVIELDETETIRRWREPWVPGLAVIGGVSSLHVTPEPDGTDRLWITGPHGVINLRVADLEEWPTPRAPAIAATALPAAEGRRLPFSGHAVTIRLQSGDIARGAELRFETRLVRDGSGNWSPASPQGLFELRNLTDGAYRFEARTVTPTGTTSDVAAFSFVVLPPWYRSGWAYTGYAFIGLAGVVGAVRYRERRVRARNAELERLVALRTAELEKANAAKDEFLASMSHEIRNPMNGVVGLSAAIDTAPLDPEGRRRFDLLRHCAAHLATLLEDILDFSRLQSGRIELHEAPFSPGELLESVAAITAADSASAGIPVTTALAPHTPDRLIGDARRLRQVLLNFVSNALKYAGRGEVEVTAWTRPAGDGRVELTFAVSDQGPGIPAEEQDKVFSKFERGRAARRARIPGTGMGLAVCRTLAEQMGGRVWLESTLGEGSTFYFSVPLARATAPNELAEPLAAAVARIRKTALVVDDEDYNRIAHAALLERHGFEVRSVPTGDAALILAAQEHFDVILLDYDMPDITGPELARRLRGQHTTAGRRPFLIAATAYSTVEKRDECLAADMDAFLAKPIAGERLREAIAGILQSQPAPIADEFIAGAVEEPADADGYVADPFDNLRLLAAHKGRTLDTEVEDYAREFGTDLETLHEAIVRNESAAAARSAHQIAGRFAFLHERTTAELALELEQLCRSHHWEHAARLAGVVAESWESVRARLSRPRVDPTASSR